LAITFSSNIRFKWIKWRWKANSIFYISLWNEIFLFRMYTMPKVPRNKRPQIWTNLESFSFLDWVLSLICWIRETSLVWIIFHKHISIGSVRYEIWIEECVSWHLLDDLLMKPWLKSKKKKKKRKKKKKKKKKDNNNIISLTSHWVTGPLASLSIECSRQKMSNSIWLIEWLVWLCSLFDLSN
jgi:hypothetical protein